MSILLFFLLLCGLLLFAVFTILYSIFVLDSVILGHDLASSRKAIQALEQIILEYKKEKGVFFDLGCCRGNVCLALKKRLPQLSIYGIDKNRIRIFFAKLKSTVLGKKIVFKNQNIFKADLKDADIIYTYLWYDLMLPLEKKLQKELKKECLIITNTSSFANLRPIQVKTVWKNNPDFEKLFVYLITV